jgi:hypothetical protein
MPQEASLPEQAGGPGKVSRDARAGGVKIADSEAALAVPTVTALLKQGDGQI